MSGDEQLDQIEQWLKAEQFAEVRKALAPLTSSPDVSSLSVVLLPIPAAASAPTFSSWAAIPRKHLP